MSGFDYTFVSEVPREYCCSICKYPMREPVQTKCGHRFCKHCLEQSMKRKRKCPIDRQGLDERSARDIYPDVAIQRTILDFVVKCPNERNDCKWTGELRTIEAHKSTCSYEGVKCTNKGCDAAPLKRDLHNHLTHECPKRNVVCLHCKTSFIWCMREGHFDVCKKYPMVCRQGCGEHKVPRDKMNEHIEHSCPLTKVECTFAHIGCKTKVQRRNIADHVKRNTECHLKLACERLKELQALSALTAASIEDVQTEMITAMNKIKELSEVVLKSGDLQDMRDKIVTTKEKLQELQSKMDANERLTAVQDEVVAIKKEVKELSRNVLNNEKLRELQDEIDKLQKLIPRIDSFQGRQLGEAAATNKKLRKLQEANASLEKQTNTKMQKLQETISSLERQNFNITSCNSSNVLDQIAEVKWELQQELQEVRENVHRDRMQRQNRFQYHLDPEVLKNAMTWIGLIILILFSACSSMFVSREEFKASSAKLEQLHTYYVDRTHFLRDEETQCKPRKFIWSFTNFESRSWQAKTGAKPCFLSEPFFIEPYGYKICLAICPNGYPVQNTHLAVFVYLLRGSNDNLLPWPFQHKVIFTLVDQQDDLTRRKNVEASISPNKMPDFRQSAAFAKPRKSSIMNTDGFGYNHFISHSNLKKRHYIRDDAILLQLDVFPSQCAIFQK